MVAVPVCELHICKMWPDLSHNVIILYQSKEQSNITIYLLLLLVL